MKLAEFNLSFLLRLAIIYACVILLVTVFQSKFIYFPMRDAGMDARAQAAGWQPWHDAQGQFIGWKTRAHAPADGPAILMFHGNAGSATWRTPWVDILYAAGFGEVRILEYPGYGNRAGQPSEAVLIEAAAQATKLWSSERGEPIILLGESLGSGVAAGVYQRSRENVAGLMLLVPYDSVRAIGQSKLPFLPVAWILRDQFDNVARLKNCTLPVVIVAASEDEVIPVKHARALRDSITNKNQLLYIEIENARHNDLPDIPEKWLPAAAGFLLKNQHQD